ncbi:Girdin [Desmophyllum pertusum]|uniref:Girdin n=1 Tax=Desmophyllum pertusum TaxID=174260 RepID=A0A9W9ZHT9_9CNID|nr:Girdin [Desmophyllum pertusum]
MSARNAQLEIENESLKNELQNSRADYSALQVDMNDVRDYYHQIDIAASKMDTDARPYGQSGRFFGGERMLGQLNAVLEEENKALVEQINKLVEQNQDLLVKSLEDKDHFMDDERAFSDRNYSLQRQKERLEEQVDLANKALAESTVKPKKKPNFLARVMEKAGLKKARNNFAAERWVYVALHQHARGCQGREDAEGVRFRSATHDVSAFRARQVRSEIFNDSDWSPSRLGRPRSMETLDKLPSSSSTLTPGDEESGDGLPDGVGSSERYLKKPGMKHLNPSASPSGRRKHHWARSSPNISPVVSRKEYPFVA